MVKISSHRMNASSLGFLYCSYMFITGLDVVKVVMQGNVSQNDLGGGMVPSLESGVSGRRCRGDNDERDHDRLGY
jgi:acetyl-CoA carboxylase carboxyltransferase component